MDNNITDIIRNPFKIGKTTLIHICITANDIMSKILLIIDRIDILKLIFIFRK